MFLNILNHLYLCVWALLLAHCLQNSRLYPTFGKEWGAKAFWLFTFVFFNPLLSLLYLLCICYAIVIDWKNRHSIKCNIENPTMGQKKNNIVPVAVIFTLTCVILVLLEVPRKNIEIQPVTILNSTEKSTPIDNTFLKSISNIGIIEAQNKIQTISSKPAKEDTPLRFKDIIIICKNNSHFLEQIALNVQMSLYKLSYVDSVVCYSNDLLPNSDVNQPDLFITLEMPQMTEDNFLLNRKMFVKINCEASNYISDILADSNYIEQADPNASFTIKSHLQHTSNALCIECPGTEYEQEIKNISRELTEAFKKQFENMMNKNSEATATLYSTQIEKL